MTTIENITNQIENDFFYNDNFKEKRYQLTEEQAEEMPLHITINNGILYLDIDKYNCVYIFAVEIWSRYTLISEY